MSMPEVIGEDIDPENADAIELMPNVFIIGAKTAEQIIAEQAIDPTMEKIEAFLQNTETE